MTAQTKFITNTEVRESNLPVDPQFLKRWSPRAFNSSKVSEVDLLTMVEAARWSPSAYNVQPWRFIYTLRNSDHWEKYLDLLDPFNSDWAKRAGALLFLTSDTLVDHNDSSRPFPSHSFDAGAAWMQFALQAQTLGYHAHAIGGIHHQQIREQLKIPERYKIEIAIAVGTITSARILPENLREREIPSQRLPLNNILFANSFPEKKHGGSKT